MAPSKLTKAIWAVKDQTTIGLARFGGGGSSSSVRIAVVKATCHDEHPPEDSHVSKILTLTSHTHVRACVSAVARRLHRTRNWAVALKALMLVRRLLAAGGRTYEQEIFFATRRGTRFFNMSDFQDTSGQLGTWDYSVFVRAYAMYMGERLEFRMRGRSGGYVYRGDEEDDHGSVVSDSAPPVREMKNERVFSRAHHLKQLLDRCLSCKPTGAAKHNRLVVVAVYPIVKESFQLYYDLTEITATLVDRFMQLEVSDMVRVHGIFCGVSKQFDELDKFYEWCKTIRVVRSSECPKVEKIPPEKLEMMEDFIHQKSDMLKTRRARSPDPEPELIEETVEPEPKELLLVPYEVFVEDKKDNRFEESTETEEKSREIGDLVNLSEELPSKHAQADQWALALFGEDLKTTSTTSPWEALDSTMGSDWETALVHSASHWSSQKAPFVGGFDTMILDSMYQQCAPTTTFSGDSHYLPLVAHDPFAASLAIAPPAYVQMSEMEKQQRLWAEEQLMWQEYTRYGMQGQVGFPHAQQGNSYPYATAGYTAW